MAFLLERTEWGGRKWKDMKINLGVIISTTYRKKKLRKKTHIGPEHQAEVMYSITSNSREHAACCWNTPPCIYVIYVTGSETKRGPGASIITFLRVFAEWRPQKLWTGAENSVLFPPNVTVTSVGPSGAVYSHHHRGCEHINGVSLPSLETLLNLGCFPPNFVVFFHAAKCGEMCFKPFCLFGSVGSFGLALACLHLRVHEWAASLRRPRSHVGGSWLSL